MKLIFNSLLIIVAASLGLAVGFAFRGKPKLSRSSSATPPLSETSKAAAWKVNPPTNVSWLDESPLATKLERDLSMSSGVTRWLYWLAALEKAMPQDFPRLARLAQDNSTALQFVAARWAEVAPQHMFETIVALSKNGAGLPVNELASVLFREWTKRDPDAVIAALSGAQEFDSRWRGNWRRTVASYVFNENVERGLLLMADWHLEDYGPAMGAVTKWAAADPPHAAEFTFRNPVGYAARRMMEPVGKEWAKTDPAGALEFAMTKQGELGSALAQSVVKEWAGRKLHDAADWLAAADAPTRNRLSSSFVETWAKQDPAGALEWCAMNLSGSTLAEAAGSALKGVAEKDLAGARAVVVAMNPSPARAEAAAAVAEKSLPWSVMAKGVPPETTAWMAGLDPQSFKRALDQVYWDWLQADSKSLAEFLKSSSTAQLPSRFYDNLAPRLARKNPLEALQWAAELPLEHAISAGSEAFAEWRRAQPEAAVKWLQQLPGTDPRREKLLGMVKTR